MARPATPGIAATASCASSQEAAILRLARAVPLELRDGWQVADKRCLVEGSMALLDRLEDDDGTKEVDGAKALLLASCAG